MSDFESIDIQIESSAKNVDDQLSNVDKALTSIQDSLKEITSALGGLDAKLTPVSGAVNRLARDIEKLNPDVFKRFSNSAQKSADDTKRAAEQIEKNIQSMVREIKKSFKISDKDGIGQLKQALTDLYNAQEKMAFADKMGDGRTYEEMSNAVDILRSKIEEIIRDYGRVRNEGEATAKNLYESVRSYFTGNNKIYIPVEFVHEHLDGEAQKMASLFGRSFTTNIEKDWTHTLTQMVEDIQGNADFAFLNLPDNVVDAFKKIYDYAKQGKDEVLSLGQAIGKGKYNAEELKSEIERVNSALTNMAQNEVDRFVQSSMGSYEEDMREVTNTANEASTSIERFNESAQGISEPSRNISDIAGSFQLMLPVIEQTANAMSDFDRYVDACFNQDMGVKTFADDLKQLPAVIEDVNSSVSTITDGFRDVPTVIGETSMTITDALKDLPAVAGSTGIALRNVIRLFSDSFDETANEIRIDCQVIEEEWERMVDGINWKSVGHTDTWQDVFEDIEKINSSMGILSQKIGEANAEMSTLVDIRNRLNKAFSSTESGDMPWDNERMQEAYKMLGEVSDRIDKVKASLKDPNKLEIDVNEPTSEIERLYARLKELQSLMSDMQNLRINFDNDQFRQTAQEIERVQARIKEIQGVGSGSGGSTPKTPKTDTANWMAQLIAIQHELEKASALFSKFGDMAKNAFLKALTPLKLFKHEFEEIKGLVTFVSRIGSAFAMISKPITKLFSHFQKQAQKSFEKIRKAWAKVMRTFTFMLIRKAITAVLTNINDATKSLAAFSKDIGTSFNSSMSLLTSDFRYVGASLVAAFEPILNYVTPILDRLVDSLVAVINKVNMFLAMLTNAKSYTIAKKKIVDYTDSVKDANKAVKQLTLGVDELNILNEGSSSSNDTEDMFDWMELPTPTVDMPEWLKWLKDLVSKLWNALKEMLKALWDAIKDAWDRVKDQVIKAFKHLIESLVGLITDILRDLTRLFNTEKFREFLEQCFRIIGKIAELIAQIIDRIREAWNYNDLGYKILEAILDILITIATHIENMLDAAIDWAKSLTFVPLFESFLYLLEKVNYAIDQIGWVIEDVFETLFLPLLKLVIENYLPRLIVVLGDIVEGIGNIAKKFHEAWQATNFGERAVKAIDDMVQALLPHIEAVGKSFKEWGNQINFEPLLNSLIKLLESLKPVADFIGGVFEDLVNHYIEPVVQHIIEEVIPKIADGIAHFADAVDWGKLRQNIDKIITAFASLSNAIGEGVAKAVDYLGQKLAGFINSKEFTAFIDTITGFVKKIDGDMVAKVLEGIGTAILNMAKAVAKFGSSQQVKDFLDAIIKFMKTKSVEDIASIIEGIAKAFLMFKGLSFLTKTASNIAGLLVPIGKLISVIGPGGALALGVAAGIATFVLFHDQIKRIDWNKLFKTVSDAIFNFVDKIDWKGVGEALAKVFVDIVKFALERAFNPAWQAMIGLELVKIVIEIIQGIGDGLLESIADMFHEMGWYGMEGFFRGFKDGWDAFWGAIAGFFQWLIDGIKKILGIASPSTVFYEIGGNVIQGLWDGIVAIWESFWSWISGLWEDFVAWAQGIWQSIVDGIVGAWNSFVTNVQTIWNDFNSWISGVWASFTEWVGSIWQGIHDTISGWWNTLVEGIKTKWSEFGEWISEIWTAFTEWVGTIWQTIHDTISGWWNSVIEGIKTAWSEFGEWINEIWTSFTEWVNEIWTTIRDTIVNWWNDIILNIQTAWTEFGEWINEIWTAFSEWVDEIWTAIRDTVVNWWNDLVKNVKEIWRTFDKWITQKWTDFKNWASDLWGKVRDFVVDAWKKIHDKAVEYWNKVKNKLNEVWTWAKENAKSTFEEIRKTITEKWNKIHEKTVEIWSNVKSFLGELWDSLKENAHTIFSDMHTFLEGLWNDIETKWQTAWNATKNTIKNLWDEIETNAHSVFERAKAFIETLWSGIKETWASAWESIHETVTSKWELFVSSAKTKFGEVQDAISQKWEEIKIDAGSAWDKIKSTVTTKWGELKEKSKEAFSELAKTVSDAWGDIKKAVGDTWDHIDDFLGKLSDKTSKFADKVKSAIESFTKLQDEAKKRTDHAGLGTDTFADGGFPSQGSLFVAGEAGAELVGTINGKTAVANTQEITDAIEEAVGSAMDKVVSMMEKALDRMAENISDSMETFVKGNKEVVVELKTINANILAIWKDAKQFIGEVYSLLNKLMTAAQYEITQSNKELKDSYQNDDSAVTSALTRITGEYEMSNRDIVASLEGLTRLVDTDMNKIAEIIMSANQAQVSMVKTMMDYIKDVVNTLRTSIETNTNTKQVAPTVENNFDTTGITSTLNNLYDTIQQGINVFYTFAEAWASVNDNYMELAKVFYDVGKTIVTQLGSLNSSLYYIAKANNIDVPMYASGGFPEDGWFRASHGEILGRFDNGQSVVANNNQITDGIAQAVTSSLVPILNDIASSNNAIASKDTILNVDSREIARASNNGQSKLGKSLISFT